MPKLIALICKQSSISAEDFKTYYETNHVPLIESIFPTLTGYKRTYLLESNMLNDALPLESEGGQTPFDVITELTFDDEDGLNQFFARGADEEVVEAIRRDESNFLDGEKTIMYRVEQKQILQMKLGWAFGIAVLIFFCFKVFVFVLKTSQTG